MRQHLEAFRAHLWAHLCQQMDPKRDFGMGTGCAWAFLVFRPDGRADRKIVEPIVPFQEIGRYLQCFRKECALRSSRHLPHLSDVVNGKIDQFILRARMCVDHHNGLANFRERGVNSPNMPFEFLVIDDADFLALVGINRAVRGGWKSCAVVPIISGIVASSPVYGACTQ